MGVVVGVSSLTALPALVGYFSRNRPQWPPGVWVPHIDVYPHPGDRGRAHAPGAGQLAHRGRRGPGVLLVRPRGIAQTAVVSGTDLEEVIMRFMPALMPVVVSLVAAGRTAAVRSSDHRCQAAALDLVGGHLNALVVQPGSLVEPMSPTLAWARPRWSPWWWSWRCDGAGRPSGAYVLVLLLAVAAAGTKGSTSLLVVAGLGVAVVAMFLWNRRLALPVLVDWRGRRLPRPDRRGRLPRVQRAWRSDCRKRPSRRPRADGSATCPPGRSRRWRSW